MRSPDLTEGSKLVLPIRTKCGVEQCRCFAFQTKRIKGLMMVSCSLASLRLFQAIGAITSRFHFIIPVLIKISSPML
jgi:hypothetical protein